MGEESTVARILGFRLADYNPQCAGMTEFVSPLWLQWPDTTEVCVLDTKVHGYHGEMRASAKLRGKGQKKVFICDQCAADEFVIKAQFDYHDACDDLLEDEPDIDIVDYFTGIIIIGTCAGCSAINEVLQMDL